MATHGEIRWPSVGSFDGRLRGDSHGRRQIGMATETLSRTRYTERRGSMATAGRSRPAERSGLDRCPDAPSRRGAESGRSDGAIAHPATRAPGLSPRRSRSSRASAPPGRARDPSWANPIFRPSADRARSGRHGVSPTRSRGAGRREVQAIAEVAHDTSPLATHPIVPFRLRPSWRGWRPDRKASSPFWLVLCDAYVGFGSSST